MAMFVAILLFSTIFSNRTECILTLKNLNYTASEDEALNDVLNKNEQKIVEALRQNPKFKQKDLVEKLCVSISTVQREMEWLSNNGYITRIGSKKDGYWKIEKDREQIGRNPAKTNAML